MHLINQFCQLFQPKAKPKQENIMAAIDDLKASVDALKAKTEEVLVKIDSLKSVNNDVAIAAASTDITAAVAKLNNAIQ